MEIRIQIGREWWYKERRKRKGEVLGIASVTGCLYEEVIETLRICEGFKDIN